MALRWAVVLLLVFAGVVFRAAGAQQCPSRCLCFRTTVRCMFLQLDHVPTVPSETTILDLRFNKISEIPANTFTDLVLLNTLLLNNNHITRIRNGAFIGLKELRYLYLYKNRIKIIEPKAFQGLPKLEQLYLHFNKIETLEPETFSELRSLDRLFLHNNKLSRIPRGVFRNMDSLRRLRLDSNALVCDCEMMWLSMMLKDKQTTTQAAATCEYPTTLQGKSLTSIAETEFHCKKPILMEEPRDVLVNFGGTVYFSCKADGEPDPDIIWLHNNNEINFATREDDKRYNLLTDGTLMIENTQEKDMGIYECMAKNAAGEVKSRVAKMIHMSDKETQEVFPNLLNDDKEGAPQFTETPQGLEVRQGETVKLYCQATGTPVPRIVWTHNNQLLSSSENIKISSLGISIKNVQRENGGSYSCTASNHLGQITSSAQIKVQVPPEFSILPRDQVVAEGRSIELDCLAEGFPQPHITWIKDGRTIIPNVNILMEGGNLRVMNSRKSDEGVYHCRAQNIVGVRESSATVTVKEKIRPVFKRQPSNVEIAFGGNIELPCEAEGDPVPVIIWRKDGNIITESAHYLLKPNGSLQLQRVTQDNAGEYECTADNGIGLISAVARVSVGGGGSVDNNIIRISLEEAKESVDKALNDTLKTLYGENKVHSPSEFLRLFRFPGPSAREIARSAEIYERTLLILKRHLANGAKFNLSNFYYSDILSSGQLEHIANVSGCLSHRRVSNCSEMCFHTRFRTFDGTCNNFHHKTWGSSETGFKRLLNPIYENGFNLPVAWSKSVSYNGFKKPSARLVSTKIVSSDDVSADDSYSHMLMQWGQFLDHDLDLAPPTISSESFVENEDCSQSCKNSPPCFPIEIPQGDPRINSRRCMEFVRSSPVCGSGSTSVFFNTVMPREQVNVLTSYIDGSMIYGSSEAEASHLRDFATNLGLLRQGPLTPSNKPYLPFNDVWPVDCRRDPRESNVDCFLAGDIRVNEQLALISMHTVWFREHNRIALELRNFNPHWDGEMLYQVARKIVWAEIQHITYQHWLPKILGPIGMKMLGGYVGYNPNIEATISNAFATAAFRFGHTLINPVLHRYNASFQPIPQGHISLGKAFFSPFRIVDEGGIDPLLRGLFGTPAKLRKADQLLNKELTEQLFRQVHAVALDLAAINIQRGRDHALPGYNEWRRFCNLTYAERFDDLKNEIKKDDLREKLQQLYGHPSNIDLWVGGISEELVEGARIGPTFMCIIVDQFKRLRDGDRFFYENPGVFKLDQLVQIKQASLARIICDNSDSIKEISRDVFLNLNISPLIKCDEIPRINLHTWADLEDCSKTTTFYPRTTIYARTKRSEEYSYPDNKFGNNTILKNKEEERMEGLESVVEQLREQMKKLSRKVKTLEKDCKAKNKNSCEDFFGKRRLTGEKWQKDNCTECQCHNHQITCFVKSCNPVDCSHPTVLPGECCPVC